MDGQIRLGEDLRGWTISLTRYAGEWRKEESVESKLYSYFHTRESKLLNNIQLVHCMMHAEVLVGLELPHM